MRIWKRSLFIVGFTVITILLGLGGILYSVSAHSGNTTSQGTRQHMPNKYTYSMTQTRHAVHTPSVRPTITPTTPVKPTVQASSTTQAQTSPPASSSAQVTPTPAVSSSTQMKVAVPSYFYPGQLWTQMENGAPNAGLAIINPDSGPGTGLDQNYATQVTQTEAKGITVIGYVSTSYAGTQNTARTLAAAEKDVDLYYSWYPNIDGIFVDEVSTDCSKESSYYLPLYNYIKAKGGVAKVVLNPGTDTSECYMSAGDIIINYEDTYSNYSNWSPSSWVSNYPASRFWQIIYNTSQTNLSQVVTLARNRHAGWIYVTDDTLPNPYDTLPSYWNSELADMQ